MRMPKAFFKQLYPVTLCLKFEQHCNFRLSFLAHIQCCIKNPPEAAVRWYLISLFYLILQPLNVFLVRICKNQRPPSSKYIQHRIIVNIIRIQNPEPTHPDHFYGDFLPHGSQACFLQVFQVEIIHHPLHLVLQVYLLLGRKHL